MIKNIVSLFVLILFLSAFAQSAPAQEPPKKTPRMSSDGNPRYRINKVEDVEDDEDEDKPIKKAEVKDHSLGAKITLYNTSTYSTSVLLFTNEKAFEDFLNLEEETQIPIAIRRLSDTGAIILVPDSTKAIFVESRKVKTRKTTVKMARIRITSGQFLTRTGLVIYKDTRLQ
jgi:hypothetical protein